MADYEGSLHGVLAGDGVTAWRSCYAGEPGTAVPCGEPHQQEAISPMVDLDQDFSAWPGSDGYEDYMSDTCDPIGRIYLGAHRSDIQIGWSQETEDEWTAGDRIALCFAITEKSVVGTLRGIGYGSLPVS